MSDSEYLKYAQEHQDKYDEREKKEALNAVRKAVVLFVVVETLLIIFKTWKKENVIENVGIMFLFYGLFYNQLYQKQQKSLLSYLGIVLIVIGIIFLLGYVGTTLGV